MKGDPATLDPEGLIGYFHPVGSRTRELLLRHGEQVAAKALAILQGAPWIEADRDFVVQAAMLHDIGIGQTHCPDLGCNGTLPYVCHGVLGRQMLDPLGLTRHGRVCERHVGVGIGAAEIVARHLPLPVREMLPITVEERLICYADKFFSKVDNGRQEKGVAAILAGLARFDPVYPSRFLALHRWLTLPPEVGSGAGDDLNRGHP